MAPGEVEVVRAAFASWQRLGDSVRARVDEGSLPEEERRRLVEQVMDEGFDTHFHPGVEYREDPLWPGSSIYTGLEAVKACFRAYNEVMRFDTGWVERVVAADNEVVVVFRSAVTPHGTELRVEHRWGYVCRVADGKVAFFQAFVEPNDAFRAAGLEVPASAP